MTQRIPDNIDINSLPTSRKEARDCGASLFYPGVPCSRGHHAPRYAKGSRKCVQCARDDSRAHIERAPPRGVWVGIGRDWRPVWVRLQAE